MVTPPNSPSENLRRHLSRFPNQTDMSPDDLANICGPGHSRDRVVRAMTEGRIDFFAIGNRRRIPVPEARKYVAELERQRRIAA